MKKNLFPCAFITLMAIVVLLKVLGCESHKASLPLPGTKSGDESGDDAKLIWNIWPERTSARYDPLTKLEKGKQYRIVLDLSAFGYGRPGVKHTPPDPELEKIIIKMKLETKDPFFELDAFVLQDTTYFEKPSHEDRSKKLTVNLNNIRKYKGIATEKMWDDIKRKGEQEQQSAYVFGHTAFTLTTRKNCDDGWASVVIVLYQNMRPIEEVKADFCVGECKEENRPKPSSKSSAFLTLSEKAKAPDGSLYFLELKQNKLSGLFLENVPGSQKGYGYISWDVTTVDRLKVKMNKIFEELNENHLKCDLERTGKTLMQNIFKDENTEAYKTFKSFVRKKMKETKDKKNRPSLFVRVVTSDQKVSPFIPFGFLLITADKHLPQ